METFKIGKSHIFEVVDNGVTCRVEISSNDGMNAVLEDFNTFCVSKFKHVITDKNYKYKGFKSDTGELVITLAPDKFPLTDLQKDVLQQRILRTLCIFEYDHTGGEGFYKEVGYR